MRQRRIGNPETLESIQLYQFYTRLRRTEHKPVHMFALLLLGLPIVFSLAALAR